MLKKGMSKLVNERKYMNTSSPSIHHASPSSSCPVYVKSFKAESVI
ncbi:hypothetical protein HanPSC8_Chr02g0060851 [Helianthus annuus]|nr:hypothetical protein HanPSC8_Chr11g0489731 [Helianthus annuus]KAJ0951505.1 hypothetical protein HanPSC8_Chr02g0060851 [Helianthus annuus]